MSSPVPVGRIPLLGAALGDALGAGVEGGHALGRAHREDRDGVGRRFFPYSPFGFQPGQLTDDTQMAWAAFSELRRGLPDVTIAAGRGEFLERVGEAYRAWYRSGPPDVGTTTGASLAIPTVDGGWRSWAGGDAAGNGSLMRATVPFVAGYRGPALLAAAALDSSLTHPDPRCVASCVWYAATLEAAADPARMADAMKVGVRALEAVDLAPWLSPEAGIAWPSFASRWSEAAESVGHLVDAAIAGRSIDCLQTPWQDWPSGFVLSSLAQAAWAALQGATADEGIRLSVLHGGRDADTIGAIAGGLVGARFGRRALDHWDPKLLDALRLGHQWPGPKTEGRFVELLGQMG